MVEVLVALLLGMIGLMGTVAVQVTVLAASAGANDSAVATRLAGQAMEELNARTTPAPTCVQLYAGAPCVPPPPNVLSVSDLLAPVVAATAGNWTQWIYLNESGTAAAAPTGRNRWARRTRVTNPGIGQPYNISVEVAYARDGGPVPVMNPAPPTNIRLKYVRLDMERRKTW